MTMFEQVDLFLSCFIASVYYVFWVKLIDSTTSSIAIIQTVVVGWSTTQILLDKWAAYPIGSVPFMPIFADDMFIFSRL